MPQLPQFLNLSQLGLVPTDVKHIEALRERPSHGVYRVQTRQRSYVLKWFASAAAIEPRVYAMLADGGVPTLPCYGNTPQALLLEDLAHSPTWRLATAADLDDYASGVAVAHWYLHLHAYGYRVLSQAASRPSLATAWVDAMAEERLLATITRLGLLEVATWDDLMPRIEQLTLRYRRLPQTFNYNDFALENLALSHNTQPIRAIVFDYDQFSLGTAYSDWRNVTGSMSGASLAGFTAAYGSVSAVEKAVDEPLSVLYGLILAADRPKIPRWATSLIEWVRDGHLQPSLELALQISAKI